MHSASVANTVIVNPEEVGRFSQRAAILEAWIEVEAAASEAVLKRAKPGTRIFFEPREALHFLVEAGVIDEANHLHAKILRDLRNKASHLVDTPGLSKEVMSSYIHFCLQLASKIRQAIA